jgi:hypothetical protein
MIRTPQKAGKSAAWLICGQPWWTSKCRRKEWQHFIFNQLHLWCIVFTGHVGRDSSSCRWRLWDGTHERIFHHTAYRDATRHQNACWSVVYGQVYNKLYDLTLPPGTMLAVECQGFKPRLYWKRPKEIYFIKICIPPTRAGRMGTGQFQNGMSHCFIVSIILSWTNTTSHCFYDTDEEPPSQPKLHAVENRCGGDTAKWISTNPVTRWCPLSLCAINATAAYPTNAGQLSSAMGRDDVASWPSNHSHCNQPNSKPCDAHCKTTPFTGNDIHAGQAWGFPPVHGTSNEISGTSGVYIALGQRDHLHWKQNRTGSYQYCCWSAQ